jgi:hypothetical protein
MISINTAVVRNPYQMSSVGKRLVTAETHSKQSSSTVRTNRRIPLEKQYSKNARTAYTSD